MLPRLSDATLGSLPTGVRRPAYDRSKAGVGIVQFGPGAFHRAHQAFYVDEVLAREGGDWAICAVAPNNPAARDALAPQDGLYTLASLGAEVGLRVIGSIREVLHAPTQTETVLARLAAPGTRIVTATVTEKGYCLDASGALDLSHPSIRRDLADPRAPAGLVGTLVEGLRRRRAAGLPPFTVVSCDNLPGNGRKLGAALAAFAREVDPDLSAWIAGEGAFPNTMVDSITPATDDALRHRVDGALGLHDAWPVQREPFTQWVVEDWFRDGRPDLAAVGVELTGDVAAFDRAKLRLLNGPHSTLAYLGLLLGRETVAEAMADEPLARFVASLMARDILPTVPPPPGFDLHAYGQAIVERFRNPGIRHLLSQIAWDGSQKLPVRLLGTVADRLAVGAEVGRLCLPVAGWLHFLRARARPDQPALVDPLAAPLLEAARASGGEPAADVARFLSVPGLFPAGLAADPRFRDALAQTYAALGDGSPAAVRRALAAFD